MAAVSLINRYSRSCIGGALRKGHDLEHSCETAGISAQQLNQPGALYGPAELSAISRHIKRMMDDEFCGLTRHRCKAGTLALASELILPSRDLEDALDKAFRLYALVNEDIGFERSAEGEVCTIRVRVAEPDLDPEHQLSEWFLLLWRNLSSWLTGEEVPVLQTRFAHPQMAPIEEYKQVFDSDCSFEQVENSISFPASHLRKPITRDLADLKRYYSTSSIDLVSFSGFDHSLRTRIRFLLKNDFLQAEKFCDMQSVARRFNLSEQSLRRRLEAQGTSYRALKEDVRKEAAMVWLRDEHLPIAEVSRRCGFAETNGLSRAMKAWTGMSPSEYRLALHTLHQHENSD